MSKGKPWKAYGRYGSIGIELVLSILLGLFVGYQGDLKFGTKPWLALLGFVIGCYAGFRQLFATAKKMEKDIEADEAKERREAEDDALLARIRRESSSRAEGAPPRHAETNGQSGGASASDGPDDPDQETK